MKGARGLSKVYLSSIQHTLALKTESINIIANFEKPYMEDY